jgi:hypothetical protein
MASVIKVYWVLANIMTWVSALLPEICDRNSRWRLCPMVSTKLSADNCMLTYVCHWELMKLVSSHGCSTLLFVMEVMVWHLWTTLIWLQPNSRGFSGEEFTYPGTKMLGTSKSQVSQEFKKKTQQQFCSLCKAPVLELYTHTKCQIEENWYNLYYDFNKSTNLKN